MSNKLDRDIRNIFVSCLEYYRSNPTRKSKKRGKKSAPRQHLEDALTKVLLGMAHVYDGMYPGWKVDKEHPGYLFRSDPPIFVRVPYHVLPTFPTDEALSVVWDLSRSIRSSDDSVICISGSNVLRKLFETFGDFDFCEYLNPSRNKQVWRIEDNLKGNDSLMCLRVSLGSREWLSPVGEVQQVVADISDKFKSDDEQNSTMKFDYIATVSQSGLSEVSNLVIAVDEGGNSASLRKTFAAQEAPLAWSDSLPNEMNNPIEMGRYIDFLSKQISKYREVGNLRKCLKRCASLARILHQKDITDSILDLATDNPVLIQHKVDELEKLRSALSSVEGSQAKEFDLQLEVEQSKLLQSIAEDSIDQMGEITCSFNAEATQIADTLLNLIP